MEGRPKGLHRRCFGLLCALAVAAGLRPATGADAQWRALISPAGQVTLSRRRAQVATVTPGLMEAGWRAGNLSAGQLAVGAVAFSKSTIHAPGGATIDVELRSSSTPDGLGLAYKLTPQAPVTLNSLHVSADFPIALVAGRGFEVDGVPGTVPAEFGEVHLWSGLAKSVTIRVAEDAAVQLSFSAPLPVLLQDNRRWGPSLSVRVGPQDGAGRAWLPGEALDVAFELKTQEEIEVAYDRPVTIQAGTEWIPLSVELDIEPGSALDFSGMGQLDAPAGKHGWLMVRPDGRLAFENDPDTLRRFYGANLCFSAHYITHEEADRLAERLSRIGYNAVRFHHYEGELVDRSAGNSVTLRPDKLDQLDYLLAALKKRGLYVTTDLFVSRPVLAAEVWDGATGDVGMDNFKMLVPVNARAFENWKAFSRALLTHVNPYTGLSYAQDPALAWLSMINEGNVGNFLGGLDPRMEQDWQAAWNAFLTKRYRTRQALEGAWGGDAGGDPLAGTVPLYKNVYDDSPRGRDLAAFTAAIERDMFARMKAFLREEIGTRALLTNMNAWTNRVQTQAARAEFDYVDDHFYVDHPEFIERPWRLPSRCGNTSPVAAGAPGGRYCAFVRLYGKPFTVSEFNYSGPGRFRGVGGILTGAMAAIQGWDVVWRFTYSSNRDNLSRPAAAGYFDIAADPLNLAAERAATCLFLRADMAVAPHAVDLSFSAEELLNAPLRNVGLAPAWHALALVTRVGTSLTGDAADIVLPFGSAAPQGTLDPYDEATGAKLLQMMRERGWLANNVTDLKANRIQSETGELLVDGPRDVMVLNTSRTAGGYAPEGEQLQAGPVGVAIEKTDATVWVSSIDGRPIRQSRRLIITHLTDLQNTGMRFGETARQTLLDWGTTPHLVLAGSATVTLELQNAQRARVWALSTGGRRVAPVAADVRGGKLVIPLEVAGPEGARMVYEVEVP